MTESITIPPFMDFEEGNEPLFGGSDFGHTAQESPTGQPPEEEFSQPEPPSLTDEELEEMRLWDAYETAHGGPSQTR